MRVASQGPPIPLFTVLIVIALLNQDRGAVAQEKTKKKPPADKQTHIRVAKETTSITEPLDTDGYVDYVAAANLRHSKRVTVDNNWEVVVRQALGPEKIHESMREEYFRRLGIPAPPVAGNYLLDFPAYAKKAGDTETDEKLVERYGRVMNAPWRASDDPLAAKWIRDSAKHVDALSAGTRRPRNYTPYVHLPDDEEETPLPNMISLLLPSVQQQREVARTLVARALLRIAEGDVKGARSDLLAIHRQGRLVMQGMSLIEALVGIAIERMACAGDGCLLRSKHLTADECRAHLKDLAALSELPMADRWIDVGERHGSLDCVQFLARQNKTNVFELFKVIQALSQAPAPREETTYVALVQDFRAQIDWNATMKLINERFDEMADAAGETDLAKRDKKLAALTEKLKTIAATVGPNPTTPAARAALGGRKGMGKFVGNVLCALLLPATSAVIDAQLGGHATLEAVRAAYAVKLHHMTTGKRAESLEEVKEHLGSMPLDPFTEEPLRLKWRDNEFVVYSVGRDRDDDDALEEDDSDIVVRGTE